VVYLSRLDDSDDRLVDMHMSISISQVETNFSMGLIGYAEEE
jgi:hypothetical protein